MGKPVPTIRNSAKALILRDKAILLQVCHIDGEVVHLLPGGTQEFGESLSDTVRREVLEETGLRVRVDGLLWVREFIARNHLAIDDAGDHVVECIYRCTPEDGALIGVGQLPDTGQVDVRWIALEELPELTMWPETVKALLIDRGVESADQGWGYLGDCP